MPIIPALGRLRREDELKASLGNMAKPCLKTPSPYKNQGTYGQTLAQLILPTEGQVQALWGGAPSELCSWFLGRWQVITGLWSKRRRPPQWTFGYAAELQEFCREPWCLSFGIIKANTVSFVTHWAVQDKLLVIFEFRCLTYELESYVALKHRMEWTAQHAGRPAELLAYRPCPVIDGCHDS